MGLLSSSVSVYAVTVADIWDIVHEVPVVSNMRFWLYQQLLVPSCIQSAVWISCKNCFDTYHRVARESMDDQLLSLANRQVEC